MLKLRHILKLRWMALFSVAFASIQLYDIFRPDQQEIETPHQKLAQEACWQIADRLPSVTPPGKLTVFCLEGDRDGYATDILKNAISYTGKFEVLPGSLITQLLKELGFPQKEMDTEKALQAAKKADATHLVTIEVGNYISKRSTPVVHISACLYEVSSARLVVPKISITLPAKNKAVPILLGGTAWLAGVIFIPFFLLDMVKAALASESNIKILLMLMLLTVIDVFLVYSISGFNMSLILLAVALILAASANYKIMDWINTNH